MDCIGHHPIFWEEGKWLSSGYPKPTLRSKFYLLLFFILFIYLIFFGEVRKGLGSPGTQYLDQTGPQIHNDTPTPQCSGCTSTPGKSPLFIWKVIPKHVGGKKVTGECGQPPKGLLIARIILSAQEHFLEKEVLPLMGEMVRVLGN